jgi:hypothetical protein
MAGIIVISRGRRGASIERRRRGICVRARSGVSLVSGSGPGGRDRSQIGRIRVLKSRIGASSVSLDIITLDQTSLSIASEREWSPYRIGHA